MEVHEKINQILKEKNITKRWFARRLIELEPKLKSTGEIPTEKTIYGYLSGISSIKIELIPYITEVLNIDENELFASNTEYKITKNSSLVKEPKNSYNHTEDKEIEKLISLLPYASKPLIKKLIKQLEDSKKLCEEI
jgi:transcriptional regulator with XRE-family HTH domain